MFQPNSIKTLLSMKNYNQLENLSKDDHKEPNLQKESLKLSESVDEIIGKSYKDPCQRIIDTKNLIKEINSQISGLQKWRQEQKLELERNLEKNKQQNVTPCEVKQSNRNDFEEYERYLDKLNNIMVLYANSAENNKMVHYSKTSNQGSAMNEIERVLAEKETKRAQLSANSTINSEVRSGMKNTEPEKLEDLSKIKESLENWKDDLNSYLRYKINADGNTKVEEGEDDERIKNMIKVGKEELKTQKYNFKDDIDDIENELKELEEMMAKK